MPLTQRKQARKTLTDRAMNKYLKGKDITTYVPMLCKALDEARDDIDQLLRMINNDNNDSF